MGNRCGNPERLIDKTPIGPVRLRFSEIHAADQARDSMGDLFSLWESAHCWKGENPLGQIDFRLRREGRIGQLINHLRVDSVDEAQSFGGRVDLRLKLDLAG